MIDFKDHIRLTKALDEAARLRARVKKLEGQLSAVTDMAAELTAKLKAVERLNRDYRKRLNIRKRSVKDEIMKLMDSGLSVGQIVDKGYALGTVRRVRTAYLEATGHANNP